MQFDKNLINSVEDRYPILIARTFRKLKKLQFEKESAQLKQLVELWEVILRYLAAVTCRTYLITHGKSAEINKHIQNFKIPSNGHWLQLLRECSKQFKPPKGAGDGIHGYDIEPGPVNLCRIIHNFYFNNLPEKRNNPIFKQAMELSQLDEKLSIELSPTTGSLFDLILKVRNWMAHTATRTEKEYSPVIEKLIPIVEHILKELDFLVNFPLYYVKEVKVLKGSFSHNVDTCMGSDFEIDRITLNETHLNNEELYVFDISFFENGKTDIKWALSLGPYLIVEQCRECHQQQVFIFNKLEKKKIEFISYQCGHTYIPSGHLQDFQEISEFLEGKIDIHTLLKGRVLGEFFADKQKLAISPESKKQANEKIKEGRRYLDENQLIIAKEMFKEAKKLDEDNAEVRFLLAMCRILNMEDIEKVVCGIKKALELDPENAQYSFAMAEIHAEIGQEKKALQYLNRTIEIDPANQEARALLNEIEPVPDSVSDHGGGNA